MHLSPIWRSSMILLAIALLAGPAGASPAAGARDRAARRSGVTA